MMCKAYTEQQVNLEDAPHWDDQTLHTLHFTNPPTILRPVTAEQGETDGEIVI